MAVATAVGFHFLCTLSHEFFVFVVEKICRLIVLGDYKETNSGPDDGDDSFDDVEPRNTLLDTGLGCRS